MPFVLAGAWALRMRPLLSVCELVDEEELVELGLVALLYGGLVLAPGVAGAGVPRIVVPRESLPFADDPCVGLGLAGVPRMVVFCGGGVAAGWLLC